MTKQEFLAMSLPYGFKVLRVNDNIIINYFGIHYVNEFDRNDPEIDYHPILHPISDLTKEIVHKGEKFVPIERLEESFIEGTEDLLVLSLEAIDYFIENEDFSRIEYLPAILIRKLIEWHFDIASLIEKGEAIDVNTLPENPYK